MQIAQKLKKENIVEYLLYMWQIEDVIRALGFDMELINEKLIAPIEVPDEEKKRLYEWYESLIDMMKREKVEKTGHLQINKNTLQELEELHEQLLKSKQDAAYPAKFYHILPFITQLKAQQPETNINDIELAFNFLYGILMLRMKKAEISKETQEAQAEIAKLFVLLAKNYNDYNEGKLDFD